MNLICFSLIADIRTYAVMPLNEECGLLQWVANTRALKTILEHYYMRNGQRLYVCDTRCNLTLTFPRAATFPPGSQKLNEKGHMRRSNTFGTMSLKSEYRNCVVVSSRSDSPQQSSTNGFSLPGRSPPRGWRVACRTLGR